MRKILKIVLLPASALGFLLAALSFSSHELLSSSNNQNILLQTSHALNEIARHTLPAVVSITSVKTHDFSSNSMNYSKNDSPFQSTTSEPTSLGIGSGVVIKPNGTILTNYHVIENSLHVTVSLDEKHQAPAHIIGGDPETDLAVIQLDTPPSSKLSTLTFADSDQIHVGDLALAVGNPFGLNRSITSGIISAVGRARLGVLDIEDFIQTDAAINPGNSGGPLINSNGEIIGINTAIFSETGGFIGIGFAVPSNIAKEVFQQIMLQGRVIRGWMGIAAQDLDEDLAHFFKAHSKNGALITDIKQSSPADQASLKVGDIVIRYNNHTIETAQQLRTFVSETKTSTKIPVQICRNGKTIEISVNIREQPRPQSLSSTHQLGGQASSSQHPTHPNSGIHVEDIPSDISKLIGLPHNTGVLVSSVKAGSPAFDAGITPGDIIISANQQEIQSSADFDKLVQNLKSSDMIVLYVQRGPEEKIFVPIKFG